MENNLNTFLSLFLLLLVTSLVFLFSKKTKILPYSILLVIVGMLIGLVSFLPGVSVLTAFKLTPEILFFVFLPILIFESAYNINIRSFYVSLASIFTLSTIGLILTAFISAGLITILSSLIGIQIPFIVSLLFGAIIASTDPVAVLSIFKELGVPNRLSLIFERESLFNDGTAVALFSAVLLVIMTGYNGPVTFLTGGIQFIIMLIGGILIGLLSGHIFSYLLKINRRYESNVLIMMFAMAHITFIGTELINHTMREAGVAISFSPIISTTIASLILGNVGKMSLSVKTNEFFEKFWKNIAFTANSIVFILMGLLFVELNFVQIELLIVALISILAVMVARLIAIYFSVGLINVTKLEPKIPNSWTKLLAWGDLKGALAIIVVLTIPENLTLPNWTLAVSVRDLIISATIGVVIASLIFKAPTIKWLAKKLRVYSLTPCESLRSLESRRLVNSLEIERLTSLHHKGYIDDTTYKQLFKQMKNRVPVKDPCELVSDKDTILFGIFKNYAIGIEKYHLQEIYAREEIPEHIYRRVYAKLIIQSEMVESQYMNKEESGRFGTILMRERIDHYNKTLLIPSSKKYNLRDKYLYYRCLAIISRKVLKELDPNYFPDHDRSITEKVLEQYKIFLQENNDRMNKIQAENPGLVQELNLELIKKSLDDFDNKTYQKLIKTNLISENYGSGASH